MQFARQFMNQAWQSHVSTWSETRNSILFFADVLKMSTQKLSDWQANLPSRKDSRFVTIKLNLLYLLVRRCRVRFVSRAEHLATWACGVGSILFLVGSWLMNDRPILEGDQDRLSKLETSSIPAAEQDARDHPENGEAKRRLEEFRNEARRMKRAPVHATAGLACVVAGGLFMSGGLVLWFRRGNRRTASNWVRANEDA